MPELTVERVAVIGGTGEEGFGLAARWADAGIEVIIGSRDAAKADDAARRLSAMVPDASITGLENPNAAAQSQVVVVTVPFAGQSGIYRSIADHLAEGAVVIDTTVPLQAAVGGRPTRVFGVWEGSAAQLARSLMPSKAYLGAAFHSLPAAALGDRGVALHGDVLGCGPKEVKEAIRSLTEAIPELRFVDAGPLENARIIESLTALLIGINRRYKTDRAGVHITNLPE